MRLNFNPNIWGPSAWFFIESSILSYPDNPNNIEIENYKNFFNSLQYILPCSKCRHNYSIHIKKYPLTNQILSNKDNLGYNFEIELIEIADLLKVQYQTTLLIFKDNKEIYRSVGETTKDLIYEAINSSI